MHLHWSDIVYFFVGVLLPTYNMFEWFSQHFGKLIRRVLIRSQRDAIAWIHYKKHAAKQGHQPKSPAECADEDCAVIPLRNWRPAVSEFEPELDSRQRSH